MRLHLRNAFHTKPNILAIATLADKASALTTVSAWAHSSSATKDLIKMDISIDSAGYIDATCRILLFITGNFPNHFSRDSAPLMIHIGSLLESPAQERFNSLSTQSAGRCREGSNHDFVQF